MLENKSGNISEMHKDIEEKLLRGGLTNALSNGIPSEQKPIKFWKK